MVYQVILEAADSPFRLRVISEMLPERWKKGFWGQQLPQNYHQLRARNATSLRHVHANAPQVMASWAPVGLCSVPLSLMRCAQHY